MGVGDGTVLGVTKVVDHGSPADRWNLVLMGDGYQAGQMTQYANDAQQFVETLFATLPFSESPQHCGPRLSRAINVYRVDVTSTEPGADDPAACGGTGATAATYFDASFCNSGIRRLLEVNNGTVISVANAQVPQWHMLMVLVNSTVYGGSGGAVATFSMAPSAQEIGLHEMGHTAFGLADEYEYYAGCGVDTNRDHYPGGEPAQANITKASNRNTIKWKDLILASTAMPTTANADCTKCDPQANPVPAGTVGAFEGAGYYHCDLYRPQFDCRMRALDHDYCAVCRERIINTLEPFLPLPSIYDILRCLESRIFDRLDQAIGRIDWVVDPSPIDRIRLGRVLEGRVDPAVRGQADALTDLLARVDSMSAGELRSALVRVKADMARLEAAARVLEAELNAKSK
jgi:hypothetical protein